MNTGDFKDELIQCIATIVCDESKLASVENVIVQDSPLNKGYTCYADFIYGVDAGVAIIHEVIVFRCDPNNPSGCADKFIELHREFTSRYINPMFVLYKQL